MKGLQQMIKAGDEQKCHVILDGLHYFKFGSYWIVEDDGPHTLRVYDVPLIRRLNKALEDLSKGGNPEAPKLDHECTCLKCGWEGDWRDLTFIPRDISATGEEDFCPDCGSSNIRMNVKTPER